MDEEEEEMMLMRKMRRGQATLRSTLPGRLPLGALLKTKMELG